MRAANDNDTDAIDEFLSQYIRVLYPILLQGQVYDLNNDMDAIVRRHAISQAAIEANHTALLEIISSPDLDREEKYRRCIEAIMPSCNNNPEDANKYYNYHMLQGITAERIAILAEKKIAGIDTYEAAGISGDAADKQRAEDLTMNAKNLENILAAYGVGRLQAKQVIRRFDTATEEAIAEFTGVSHGAYPSV
jgi:hypothetical protein